VDPDLRVRLENKEQRGKPDQLDKPDSQVRMANKVNEVSRGQEVKPGHVDRMERRDHVVKLVSLDCEERMVQPEMRVLLDLRVRREKEEHRDQLDHLDLRVKRYENN